MFPKKGRCIDTRNHDQQCSDWLTARQQHNDISLKKTSDEKLDKFLDLYQNQNQTFIRKQTRRQNNINVIIFICTFCYMIPNYLYSRFLVFVYALLFYFNVVISNSFNVFSSKQIFYVTALIKVICISCASSRPSNNICRDAQFK